MFPQFLKRPQFINEMHLVLALWCYSLIGGFEERAVRVVNVFRLILLPFVVVVLKKGTIMCHSLEHK